MSTMSKSFLDASIPIIVEKLKLDEKIALLGAPNWWNTSSIPRLEIPSVRMSDGPNGVRGSSHFVSTPAQCLPCATSFGATFDQDLIRDVGAFLAAEAKIKSSVILLAPTCNIQRSPLGGRAFESFSEDPYLSGMMAAAYVNGLQSDGVAATIKHFVANDQEHERTAADSVVSERALREIYLYPFMLAQIHAKPWAFMTAYGRIDGVHCSENPRLLKGILREEWGFDGIVISDWYGTYSVDHALNASMDLEMPGPPRWRQNLLVKHTLSAQKLLYSTVNARVANMLQFIQRLARRNPDVVYGDGEERSRDTPEMRKFCRTLAAEGMVLLKNGNNLLPIKSGKAKKVAVIGPGVHGRVISGGGSAALKASYVVTPWEGLQVNAPDGVELSYHIGCYAHKFLPTIENFLTTPSGEPGWLASFYSHDEDHQPIEHVADFVLQDTRVKLNDFLPKGLGETWTIKLRGRMQVPRSALWEMGLTVSGRAKLWMDGELLIDNWTEQRGPGEFFYGQGTVEEKATIDLHAEKQIDVLVEYSNYPPPDFAQDDSQPALMIGVRLGGCEKIDADQAIDQAAELAATSDVTIFIGGLTPEWESEGFDRPTLDMPGRQNELIERLAAANPRTVVVLQAGSAVSMPWVDAVSGILQAWYCGNETGNAIADVLFGVVNPSGRLPLTFPTRIQDVPAFPNLRSEHGRIYYREDVFVGYRHYQTKLIKPLFPFGFGLSYTSFRFSDIHVTQVANSDKLAFEVATTVTNTGDEIGSEVVQVYVSYPKIGVSAPMPTKQLKGFAKARSIDLGQSKRVKVRLDKWAFAFWDEQPDFIGLWRILKGEYDILVGASSEDVQLQTTVEVKDDLSWTGL
ncbi:hypothetical protein PUNSTDRAFT_154781 [Punctularia strigosozonata HHB-11173 SS5]|uniref:uncharacterized protein n=1 Tax=Punctularia strigosozonata (strain HHB-11173) TaxID=741275 RepID=UPI00044178DE|nr:uncharacterized protein PUNSTDRAFT_154781 [Punctularia strigosozonata HHB-11173 SS5]EIN08123.1 hypothetical protein PUNSTDRAFT_154781 [Punctularia strigosozonata HHB-11173 SS5]